MKNLLSILTGICITVSVNAQNPDSSQQYFKKAMNEKEAGRYLVASKLFEKAIAFDVSKEAYLQLAYTQLEMKKTDYAKASFLKVHELDPSDKTVIKELMELFFNYRQFEKATEFAKKCSDCENNNRILGLCYYEQEDYAEAEKYLTAALKKDPNDAQITYTMGRNYVDMDEYKKAIPYYTKAIQLDDTRNVWMYELGLLYYTINDYKNALSSLDAAAAHGYAKSNDFIENLGYVSLYSGQIERGESLLLDIYRRKPGNKDILRDMAEILYQQKQYDKSLNYCQKLMEMDMKDGKALYQAGLCFQKKGEVQRGQKMCDKAIELDPSLDNLRRKKEMSGGL